MGQNQQKTILQWDEVSRKLIKQCCTKKKSDISSASQARSAQ